MNCSHRVYGCPFFNWLEIFEKKWNARIVKQLYKKTMGFNELKHSLRGVTQGVLSQRLDELEKSGILTRKIVKQKPLVVEYSLNKKVRDVLNCWEKEEKPC